MLANLLFSLVQGWGGQGLTCRIWKHIARECGNLSFALGVAVCFEGCYLIPLRLNSLTCRDSNS